MNLRCRVLRGAAPLLLTEGVEHESLPHRLPGIDRDLGRVVGHSHGDLEPDHLVGATTQTTELVRSRPDCQIMPTTTAAGRTPRAQRWPAGTTGSRSNRLRSGTSPSTTREAARAPHSPPGPPAAPDEPSASGSADCAAVFAGAGHLRPSAQLSLSRYSYAPLVWKG